MYTHIYTRTHTYTHTYVHTYIYIYIYEHAYTYIYIYGEGAILLVLPHALHDAVLVAELLYIVHGIWNITYSIV